MCRSKDLHLKLGRQMAWLQQPYDRIIGSEYEYPPEARLRRDDIIELLQAKQIEETTLDDVMGCCRVFTVPEVAKRRVRVIKETVDINRHYGKDTLEGTKFLSRKQLLQSVHDGTWQICVDFAAYYDQFRLGERVRPYCCFSHGGKIFRLTRMAMGQRQTVDIACTVTEVTLDFDLEGVKAKSHVDNVCFRSDDFNKLLRVFDKFVQRCQDAGITINEVHLQQKSGEQLLQSEGEFLGVDFDLVNKKVRVGKKTMDKLRMTTERLRSGDYTTQHYLSHMGLLFYVSPILRLQLSEFYYAIREYSEVSRELQAYPEVLWCRMRVTPDNNIAN
jgi:hypothetical protein